MPRYLLLKPLQMAKISNLVNLKKKRDLEDQSARLRKAVRLCARPPTPTGFSQWFCPQKWTKITLSAWSYFDIRTVVPNQSTPFCRLLSKSLSTPCKSNSNAIAPVHSSPVTPKAERSNFEAIRVPSHHPLYIYHFS